ncbi:MAG: B12-binding domain-containing radical SAM protein, partial [Candidatus Sumerlaeota bacterium]
MLTSRMAKILFIHPLGENYTRGREDMARLANIMPPLGLCGLASWVESLGHQADIHDCYAHPGGSDAKIDRYLRAESPDYVGFSTTTSSFPDAIRIARAIGEGYPDITILFGGVHISALGARLLEDYREIDIGVVGEGERPLQAILSQGADAKRIRSTPGIIFRAGSEIISNPAQKADLDIDALPFPDYGKLEGFPDAYKLPIFNYPRSPATTMVSSRGCPYQCSYCDRSVFRRSFRFNSADYMVEQMKMLRRRFGVRHVNFYDDLFTFHRDRVVEFCEALARANMPVSFNCAARAEHLDGDLLDLLKRAGCWMISLGIETGDPELLAQHRSHADLDMIAERVRWIRRAGIRAKGLFMLGLPGETEASIDKSIDYALSLPLNDLNVSKFTPFPGSPVYAGIHAHG